MVPAKLGGIVVTTKFAVAVAPEVTVTVCGADELDTGRPFGLFGPTAVPL